MPTLLITPVKEAAHSPLTDHHTQHLGLESGCVCAATLLMCQLIIIMLILADAAIRRCADHSGIGSILFCAPQTILTNLIRQ